MPHLRLEVAEEWLRDEFRLATGFDARKLLNHLVQVVAGLRMEKPGTEGRRDSEGKPIAPEMVPMINLSNLKHAIVPLYYAHVAGDRSKRFLHVTLSAGNDTPGRTAAVRLRAAQTLGDEVDQYTGALPALAGLLASVTAHVLDIDRDRGYSTTAERKRQRDAAKVDEGAKVN